MGLCPKVAPVCEANPNLLEAYKEFAQARSAEAAELRVLLAQLDRRTKRAEYLLDTIYSSWTWRVGRLVLFPVSIARYVRSRQVGMKVKK